MRNVAASIYFARLNEALTSLYVIEVGSVIVTPRASVSIFVTSALVIVSFGRNRVALWIIPFDNASDTYGAYQILVATSLNGIVSPVVGSGHPVELITIFRNSARVRLASGR